MAFLAGVVPAAYFRIDSEAGLEFAGTGSEEAAVDYPGHAVAGTGVAECNRFLIPSGE